MTQEQMLEWLKNYWDVLRSMDTDRWVDLYTDDATVQDPVGGPVYRGKAELRTFFEGVRSNMKLLDLTPEAIYFTPPEAAVHFAARAIPQNGPEFVLRGIVNYAFAENGKVTKMRAFWSM